ncbi:lymphatic vessel endothelial hyaluronic receptor 1b [Salminus brasiliensis]|uniref:lymphatic vessel endothelial hyaluronic receptor 1b n=1 Tax=Salminus brasiliensis TaxID=930266 RepID=UPI003B82F1BA
MKSSMGLTLCCLLSLVLCTASLDLSQIEVYPENGGISGVFMAMLKNKAYSFNASTATEVCRSLSARIATKAEVEMAHRDGLETCRFGWVEENIVVVPRINQHEKCGKNKVGVVSWFTSTSRLFEVFCFNSTGQSEVTTTTTPATTNPVDRGPQDNTTFPRPIQSTASNKNFLSPSSSVPSTSSGFSTSVAYTSFPSTVSSMATRSPPSLSPSTAHYPISTSSSSSTAPYSSTTLFTHLLTYSSSLNSSSNQTGPPALDISTASFGEVPTACVVIAVMLILMAAAGAVWYFKIKRSHRLPPWVRIRHKDMVETEMWKHIEQKQTGKNKEKRSSSEDIPLQLEDTDSA